MDTQNLLKQKFRLEFTLRHVFQNKISETLEKILSENPRFPTSQLPVFEFYGGGTLIKIPELTYEETEPLKTFLEALFKAEGTGIMHTLVCRIDGNNHDFNTLRNLINTFLNRETLICNSLGIEKTLASKLHEADELISTKIHEGKTKELESEWDFINENNHQGRFGIDLSGWLSEKFIDFKYALNFADANLIMGLAAMSLAINNQAQILKNVGLNFKEFKNEKFAMRTWLNRMGIKGVRFKAERKALLKNLKGDSAWSSGVRPEIS